MCILDVAEVSAPRHIVARMLSQPLRHAEPVRHRVTCTQCCTPRKSVLPLPIMPKNLMPAQAQGAQVHAPVYPQRVPQYDVSMFQPSWRSPGNVYRRCITMRRDHVSPSPIVSAPAYRPSDRDPRHARRTWKAVTTPSLLSVIVDYRGRPTLEVKLDGATKLVAHRILRLAE